VPLDVGGLALEPPDGWWTIMRALGSEKRMFFSPAQRSSDPMEAAWPMHSVETPGLMNCIVS
jgi:hypothetical protein